MHWKRIGTLSDEAPRLYELARSPAARASPDATTTYTLRATKPLDASIAEIEAVLTGQTTLLKPHDTSSSPSLLPRLLPATYVSVKTIALYPPLEIASTKERESVRIESARFKSYRLDKEPHREPAHDATPRKTIRSSATRSQPSCSAQMKKRLEARDRVRLVGASVLHLYRPVRAASSGADRRHDVTWTPSTRSPRWPLTDYLTTEDRARLRNCPCSNQSKNGSLSSLCLPVDFVQKTVRKEIFAFSVAKDDRWKHYDWDQLTTVAWNEDKQLLCHAHSKGVKVVVQHNFDDIDLLCNGTARRDWIKASYSKIVENFADGVNIDTEKPMHGATSQCLGLLVQELRVELEQHALTKNAQITFDVPWAPHGIDGRYYSWRELSVATDFLFVMAYDMRSQVYDACIAGANSPFALVKQGLEEFLFAYGIAPDKLVLGVPWYGYSYRCLEQEKGTIDKVAIDDSSWCEIQPVPFFGAPCSDAAGDQINYGDIQRMIKTGPLLNQWDPISQTPFVKDGRQVQIWFDDPRSLRAKYALARELGLRGVGMWNADTLDYLAANDSQIMWDSLAEASVSYDQ
ncbi:hypothetical protein PsorP6_013607 [Peronosclerospora sorghi]|uniref:Uncharacterized protein n=1 Tax=Peronosclerospora sorghi TaxID=230839 RepID=A0ACC0VHV0_9STRA|nr:hypothetical protein PsorP6_013607 [Peronosclerospora sorghi]